MELKSLNTTSKFTISIDKEIVKSEEVVEIQEKTYDKIMKTPLGVRFCDYIRSMCSSCNGCIRNEIEVQIQIHVQNEVVQPEKLPVAPESKIYRKCSRRAGDYYVYYLQ